MRTTLTALILTLVACNPDPPAYEDGETLPNGQMAGDEGWSGGGGGTTVLAGHVDVGPSDDFVPLSGGQVAIGDKSQNQIRVLAPPVGNSVKTFSLTDQPGDLALDSANNLLYATLLGTTNLARIDLGTNLVTYIALPFIAVRIAIGNAGRVFVSLNGGAGLPNYEGSVAVIDGPAGTVVNVQAIEAPHLLAFDRVGNQLIAGHQGLSPSSLERFSFDPATDTLTSVQELWSAGTNGQDLVVSADGLRIAFPCGGGNGAGYTIFDYSTADLNTSNGQWDTGPYPRSACFSPNSARIVATEGGTILIYDVATHVLLQTVTVDITGLSYTMLAKVGYSPEGTTVYAYTDSGFSETSGRLYFYNYP